MNMEQEWLFFNLLLVSFVLYLFIFLISIFGFIFLFLIKKINKSDWGLNKIEYLVLSFSIGLSIYISYSFIIDIFQVFNFFTAYLPILVIDILFISFLFYKKKISKKSIENYFLTLIKKLNKNSKKVVTFFLIIIVVLSIQIYFQWRAVTEEYALASKDTYLWLGHYWYLLEEGCLWREGLALHYPKGYVFFLAGPVLIHPNYRFAYFFFKFGGIPFFSFFIITLSIILKKIFEKNFLILFGLILTLLSTFIFARFDVFTSSVIPTFLILVIIIILNSKCPFYIVGFLISLAFLTNSVFALFLLIGFSLLFIVKMIFRQKKLKSIFFNDILKTSILCIILLIPYIINTIIVQNVSLFDIIYRYSLEFGIVELNFIKINEFEKFGFLLRIDYSDILKQSIPDNDITHGFLDIEKKILSLFFIFDLIGLILPRKKIIDEKRREIFNFLRISVIVVLFSYAVEIIAFMSPVSIWFLLNFAWIKWRALEAFVGPCIVMACLVSEIFINKTKKFTIWLSNKCKIYKKMINNDFGSKFLKIENIIIILLLISSMGLFVNRSKASNEYYFNKDHIDTIFYIKDNIPENSKILVNFYDGTGDALHSALSNYKLYDWEFSEGENNINEIKQYIVDKNIKFVLIDLETVNSTELDSFLLDPTYKNLFENEIHVLLEFNIYLDC